jgi:hypothetical protein
VVFTRSRLRNTEKHRASNPTHTVLHLIVDKPHRRFRGAVSCQQLVEETMTKERILLQLGRVIEWLTSTEDANERRHIRQMTYFDSRDLCGSAKEVEAYVVRCELVCSWPIRKIRRRLKNADMANYQFVRRAFYPRPSDWWW